MAKARIPPSNPHFFKPIMPGSLEQISIPKAFMVNYLGGENCEGKSQLKTKTGKSWNVTINKGSFTDGWEAFVTENNLCIGDILVFKHEGDLNFDVIMFNSTACEKQYPPLEDQRTEQEQVPRTAKKKMKQTVGNCPYFTLILQPHNFNWSTLYIPNKFGRENGLTNKKCEITLKEANGKCWNASLRYKPSADSAYIRGGWREFSEANRLKVGDTCKFKLMSCVPNNIIMEVSISRSKYSGSKADSKVKRLGSSPPLPPSPPRATCPPPEFTATLQPYNFNWSVMYIPSKFGRENCLTNKVCMIKLSDRKGKTWDVNLRCKKSQDLAYLAAGWSEFSDANKLKLGDECTFKLVSKGSKNIVMEVSILRSKCSV